MEWSRVAVAFAFPIGLWLLALVLLAIQLILLMFFEVRIAAGIIERRISEYAIAIFAVAAISEYDRSVAAPLLAAAFAEKSRDKAQGVILVFLIFFSLLSTAIVFHYSNSNVTRFRGRSLLVFPKEIYDRDPVAVRQIWTRIFNLVGLTSIAIFSLMYVYAFSFAMVLRQESALNSKMLGYLAGLAAAGLLTYQFRVYVLRFPSRLILIAKLNQIIAQNAKPNDQRRSLSPRKHDQLSWARGELIHVTILLERLANREDSLVGPDVRHPSAAILRAAADQIRRFCSSPKSLDASLPITLVSTLRAVEGYAISGDSLWRGRLIKQLNVFDADGNPRELATKPSAGSVTRFARVGARYTDRALIWLKDRWQAIAIILVLLAVILGRLDLKDLLNLAN